MVSKSTSPNEDAVTAAQTVIDDKDDSQDRRSPGIDWRWLAALSALFVAVALVASIFIFGGSLAKIARQSGELTACRARYALAVTDAQVKAEIIEYRLFNSLADRNEEERIALVDQLESMSRVIEVAVLRRAEFERNVTLPCPLEEVPLTSGTLVSVEG